MIPAMRRALVWHGAGMLACSFECVVLRRRIIIYVYPCEWSRTVAPQAVDVIMAQWL